MSIPFHKRRPARLEGHDYTLAGAYYVTICTAERACLFGEVEDGEMRLNDSGCVVQSTWVGLPNHYHRELLDAFVVMPNHIHGVLSLVGEQSGHGLPEIIRGFKTFSARRINEIRKARGIAVWQRSYHDHVIRDDADLDRIRRYIADNPASWADDPERTA
jgi:putative transposase